MNLSDEARAYWDAHGYNPYNEEHWRYAQEQAAFEDWLSYAQYDAEWMDFMASSGQVGEWEGGDNG